MLKHDKLYIKIPAIILMITLMVLTFQSCTTEPDNGKGGNGSDTTSHNYVWEKFTFGGAASSSLRDVAIVDENNIWAVGEIYINDSSGHVDPVPYNAVYWNGNTWTLKRIPFTGSCSAVIYPRIESIWGLTNSVIFARGGSLVFYDGLSFNNDCGMNSILNGKINKIWGSAQDNLFVVGNLGSILHYNGQNWRKIESGTNLNINDIWGAIDKDGKEVVLCAAYNFGSGGEKKLLRIKNLQVDEIEWVTNRELYTVWFKSIDRVFAGGEGLFVRENELWTEEELPALFKFKVRGTELNNIWTVGGYGFAAHFNGADWKEIEEIKLSAGNYEGLAVKDNIVAMVGFEGNSAVITIGKRKNP